MRQTRSVTLDLPTDLLNQIETIVEARSLSLSQAVEASLRQSLAQGQPTSSSATQDRGAREALTKLKERTAALEALTAQMTTHMRMLQDEVDGLKRPERQSPQELIAEYLPTHSDDFSAGF